MSEIATRIRTRRRELGISMDALASAVGRDRATIYRYENGEIENMPFSVVALIAEALRCSPSYLVGWSDEKPEAPKDPAVMELEEVFADLNDENRGKLLEIAHLYLNSQK